MCDALGTEPVAEDIPIGLDDLPAEVQLAVEIHSGLPIKIAEFSGTYLGRSIGELGFLFELYDITDSSERKFYYKVITLLDSLEVDRSFKAKKRKDAAKVKKAP